MKVFSMTSKLLKNKEEVYQNAKETALWPAMLIEFILVSLVSLALFGVIMATESFSINHALDLSWKMIVLIWGPLVICLPSLFVFSVVRGSKIKLTQLIYLTIGNLAIIGIVLISLAPIVWFFTWTGEGSNIIDVMDIITIGVSLLFGFFFLKNGFMAIYKMYKEKYPKSTSATDIIFIWLILLVIVIFQMSHKLQLWFN
jgi:hypothetical protein